MLTRGVLNSQHSNEDIPNSRYHSHGHTSIPMLCLLRKDIIPFSTGSHDEKNKQADIPLSNPEVPRTVVSKELLISPIESRDMQGSGGGRKRSANPSQRCNVR